MQTIDDNMLHGILLEDPIVEDSVPTERESPVDFLTTLLAVTLPGLATAAAAHVIPNGGAIFVWIMSATAGAYYVVRRMPIYPALLAAIVYSFVMLWQLLYIAMFVGNILVLHGE